MTHNQTQDDDFGPAEFDELADLAPGSTVGPYLILDRLGRGGMGQVFLANDARLRRKVALKCLLSQRNARQDVRSQVLREARASAGISHPHVATVHDVIEHGPRVFIVMEYVEGESLSARLKRGRLPISTVIRIGRQLASALAAAHARGIVHRDLKPANIQVALDGSVKVVDFGVAAAVAIPATLTAATEGYTDTAFRGLQAGTPGYMSPEQLVGRDAEPRSDIFSLGIVLFELATGHRLFADSDPLRIIAALSKPMPRADAIDPAVPRELGDIIARALETDPGQRIQSAAEFESALAALDQLRDRTTTRDRVTPPSGTPEVTAGVGVGDLRGRLILAHSPPELLRLKYEVEQYLATRPHDVDGRVLRDDVDRAIGTGLSSARGRRLGYVLAGTASLVICTALGISLYRSAPMTPALPAAPQLVVEAPTSSPSKPSPPTAVVSFGPLPRSIPQIPPPAAKGASRLLTSDQAASAARGARPVVAPQPSQDLQPAPAAPTVVALQRPQGPQPAPAATTQMFTISPVPRGGTIEAVDILCGTKGSVCSVNYPEGLSVTLHPTADPGFTFVGFLGDCAPVGQTQMAGPRTCGATFVLTKGAPPPTPEELAKGQIQALLKDFCAAFEAIDPQAVQRVFPTTDMAALRRQLNKSEYKSVQCRIADTVFLSLNPSAGTARVQAGLKRVYERTRGTEPPVEQIVSMTLSRPEPRGRWYINAATYQPKPK